MQKSALARILSIRQTSTYMGLLILLFNLFSGNLQAENIEFSEFPVHGKPIFQTSTASTMDNYDVLSYDIDLKVKFEVDAKKIIWGTVGFEARVNDNEISEIEIDLADNMKVTSVYNNESGPLDFNRSENLITVFLDKTFEKDSIFSVFVTYEGWPEICGLQGFRERLNTNYNLSRVIATLSEPECARSWWPCKDRVNDKANMYHITLQVDTGLTCISNGRLVGIDTLKDSLRIDTAQVYHYEVNHPMTTYNFALAISKYIVWDDGWWYYIDENNEPDSMPIVHYVFDTYENDLDARISWKKTSDALDFFSDWFGLYPFADEKYGHVQYYGLPMEHQTISFMPGLRYQAFEKTKYLAHELAHQWWGNMVTCSSWNHVWVQEGMATYAEDLFYEFIENDIEKFKQDMNNKRVESTRRSVYVEDATDIDAVFDTNYVYNKGAWVVHMLRGILGDENFKSGLRAITNSEYRYRSITTEIFRDVIEKATQTELDKFFEQWIYGKGIPIYEWSYWQGLTDSGEENPKEVYFLRIEQVQKTDPEIFEMPVDFVFEFESGGDDTTVTLEVDNRITVKAIAVDKKVKSIKFDPDNWVLQKNTKVDWKDLIIITRDIPEIPELALKNGKVDKEYLDRIYTSSSFDEVKIELISDADSFPDGLELSPNGLISGTCEKEGVYHFTVSATDLINTTLVDVADLSLTIKGNPEKFTLYQNYPNPFNSGTFISFDLAKPGNTTIEIFNVLGQKVTTLIDGYYFADYEYKVNWQGRDDLGQSVSSGIYFYRLKSGDFTSTRKMLLLK